MTDHPTPKKPEPDSTVKGALKAKIDSGLLRSSGVVSFFTMLSRVMGLIRDIVLARVIGAEALADVFFVAFKIPNFFRRLFAEGAFAQAFVPVLADYKAQGSMHAVKALIDRVAGVLGGMLIPITLEKLDYDPAIASSPFVTTVTDVVGNFAFLGIATLAFHLI